MDKNPYILPRKVYIHETYLTTQSKPTYQKDR